MKSRNMSGILIIWWRIALILLLIIIGIVITLIYIHMLFGVLLLVSVFVLVPSWLLWHLGLSDVLVTFMVHRLIPASSSILLVPTTRIMLRPVLATTVTSSSILILLILRWCLLLLLIIRLIHSMSSRIVTSMMTWSRIIRLVMLLLLMMHSLYTILLVRGMIIIRIWWRKIWLIRVRIVGMLFADGMCVALSVLTVAVNEFKYKLFSNLLFSLLPYNFNLPLLVMRVRILLRNKDFGVWF